MDIQMKGLANSTTLNATSRWQLTTLKALITEEQCSGIRLQWEISTNKANLTTRKSSRSKNQEPPPPQTKKHKFGHKSWHFCLFRHSYPVLNPTSRMWPIGSESCETHRCQTGHDTTGVASIEEDSARKKKVIDKSIQILKCRTEK